jgi:hypothetical protein
LEVVVSYLGDDFWLVAWILSQQHQAKVPDKLLNIIVAAKFN